MIKATSLISKEASLAVVGLGYVGLPIALKFAKIFNVIGFDINHFRIELMKNKIDPSGECEQEEFDGCNIQFTHDPEDLNKANFFIIAVPTPINDSNYPDLTHLNSATQMVGKALKVGDIVVYESTVYPGCTEEDCIPVLEKISGLTNGVDFFTGYSPERINPGDKEHSLENIVKVVSGCNEACLNEIAAVYGQVIKAGIYKAESMKVAEAAKIIENTQRDVNIALINELSMIFNKMGINTYDVLNAAGTKWNFLKFYPGLVGGHCIGVDPYYLTYKANKLGFHSMVITSGRRINDSMGTYVAKEIIKRLLHFKKNIIVTKVLIMGITFKENVSDIRNSKVVDIISELKAYSCNVEVMDPLANADDVWQDYGIRLIPEPAGKYDAIVVAVNHAPYVHLTEDFFLEYAGDDCILVDIKGIYQKKIKTLHYWSL